MILIHASRPSLDSTSASSTTLPTRSPKNAPSSRAVYTDAAGKYLQARTGGRHRPRAREKKSSSILKTTFLDCLISSEASGHRGCSEIVTCNKPRRVSHQQRRKACSSRLSRGFTSDRACGAAGWRPVASAP